MAPIRHSIGPDTDPWGNPDHAADQSGSPQSILHPPLPHPPQYGPLMAHVVLVDALTACCTNPEMALIGCPIESLTRAFGKRVAPETALCNGLLNINCNVNSKER
jgi:hypothetical protein